MPIGRGVRARKYKAHYATNVNGGNITINPCTTSPVTHHRLRPISVDMAALASDEENTSEYSHPPSSEHSTLESNPDIPICLKTLNHAAPSDADDSSLSSSSDSDLAASDSEEDLPQKSSLNQRIKALNNNSMTTITTEPKIPIQGIA